MLTCARPALRSVKDSQGDYPDALDHGLRHASSGFRTVRCDVVADPFEIIRHPSSSGRASAAIAPIRPSSNVIVLDQPAFTCGGAALFDFAAEPLVMIHRAGQQIERHLCGPFLPPGA